MYLFTYTHVYPYPYIYIYLQIYIWLYVYVFIYTYAVVHITSLVSPQVYMYPSVYADIYVYIYVYIYIYICIYTGLTMSHASATAAAARELIRGRGHMGSARKRPRCRVNAFPKGSKYQNLEYLWFMYQESKNDILHV